MLGNVINLLGLFLIDSPLFIYSFIFGSYFTNHLRACYPCYPCNKTFPSSLPQETLKISRKQNPIVRNSWIVLPSAKLATKQSGTVYQIP